MLYKEHFGGQQLKNVRDEIKSVVQITKNKT